ncbi:MAG: hypothetical protein LWW81_09350 [Rhodocyclales bacterium]|nr:hypothetical protein [Rhodocyclales bacterium]
MGKLKAHMHEMQHEAAMAGRKRRRVPAARKNSPVEVREAALAEEISACLEADLSHADAEARIVAWNALQAAPLAIGKVKKTVFLAYRCTS